MYNLVTFLTEMANFNIAPKGASPFWINILPQEAIHSRHWNRIKVIDNSGQDKGSVPLNSRKLPTGDLTSDEVNIVRRWGAEYQLLITALWTGKIKNKQAEWIYDQTLQYGVSSISKLVQQAMRQTALSDEQRLHQTLHKMTQRSPTNPNAPYRQQMPIIEGLQTIRGVRMLQFLAEESTYAELERKTRAFKPVTKRRQFAVDPIKIVNLDITPYLGTKMLLFRGLATSSKGGGRYKTIVSFSKVKFEPESTNTNVTFTASDGEEYSVQPIKLSNNNARVRCQCLDFYYRFATFDYNDKSLYGRAPRPYVRKTPPPPLGRPWANPMKTPGVCKHVLKTVQSLMDAGLVVR